MGNIIVLTGIPGSGKTTFARENYKDAYIIDCDYIREMINGGKYAFKPELEPVIYKNMYSLAEDLLKKGDVIIDDANVTSDSRVKITELFKGKAEKMICVNFQPQDEFLKRRMDNSRGLPLTKWAEVHKDMISKYQRPSVAEGFDKIIDIKNNAIVNVMDRNEGLSITR